MMIANMSFIKLSSLSSQTTLCYCACVAGARTLQTTFLLYKLSPCDTLLTESSQAERSQAGDPVCFLGASYLLPVLINIIIPKRPHFGGSSSFPQQQEKPMNAFPPHRALSPPLRDNRGSCFLSSTALLQASVLINPTSLLDLSQS